MPDPSTRVGTYVVTRTVNCSRCRKDFEAQGPGPRRICDKCKGDKRTAAPTQNLAGAYAAAREVKLREEAKMQAISKEMDVLGSVDEQYPCPRCEEPMVYYGNQDGQIIPMNPPEENVIYACHRDKLRVRIRRPAGAASQDYFTRVRHYELMQPEAG